VIRPEPGAGKATVLRRRPQCGGPFCASLGTSTPLSALALPGTSIRAKSAPVFRPNAAGFWTNRAGFRPNQAGLWTNLARFRPFGRLQHTCPVRKRACPLKARACHAVPRACHGGPRTWNESPRTCGAGPRSLAGRPRTFPARPRTLGTGKRTLRTLENFASRPVGIRGNGEPGLFRWARKRDRDVYCAGTFIASPQRGDGM